MLEKLFRQHGNKSVVLEQLINQFCDSLTEGLRPFKFYEQFNKDYSLQRRVDETLQMLGKVLAQEKNASLKDVTTFSALGGYLLGMVKMKEFPNDPEKLRAYHQGIASMNAYAAESFIACNKQ